MGPFGRVKYLRESSKSAKIEVQINKVGGDMLKRGITFLILIFIGVLAVYAKPMSVWTNNYPVDGRHATRTEVSISSYQSTTALSTDAARASWYGQINNCAGSVYWDIVSVSTMSAYLRQGDYFTSDGPIAWQGAVYLMASSPSCTAIMYNVSKNDL